MMKLIKKKVYSSDFLGLLASFSGIVDFGKVERIEIIKIEELANEWVVIIEWWDKDEKNNRNNPNH